jgi:transcription elongation factor Elf1
MKLRTDRHGIFYYKKQINCPECKSSEWNINAIVDNLAETPDAIYMLECNKCKCQFSIGGKE